MTPDGVTHDTTLTASAGHEHNERTGGIGSGTAKEKKVTVQAQPNVSVGDQCIVSVHANSKVKAGNACPLGDVSVVNTTVLQGGGINEVDVDLF